MYSKPLSWLMLYHIPLKYFSMLLVSGSIAGGNCIYWADSVIVVNESSII